jgi:hypothetical protein
MKHSCLGSVLFLSFISLAVTSCGGDSVSTAAVGTVGAALTNAECDPKLDYFAVSGAAADLVPLFGGKTITGNLYAPPAYVKGKASTLVVNADGASGTLDGVAYTVTSVCYSKTDTAKTTALVFGTYTGGKKFTAAQFYVGAYTFAGVNYKGTVNDLNDTSGATLRTGAWAN